jgi:crotonobetainyl-CoA:carnitine CoA-transferase CaiB-like acyl-CoA transferase
MATDLLLNLDWENFDMFTVTQEETDSISEPIGAFFRKHTGKELLKGAVARGISIGPLSSLEDLLNDECLNARRFWKEIAHPELGTSITYPREFVKLTEVDASVRFRAPLIGEHNGDIYRGLGLSQGVLQGLKQDGII